MKFPLPVLLGLLLSLNLSAQNFGQQKYIDSLILVSKSMPDDSLKAMTYGRIYEQLMFRNPELSFQYIKLEYKFSNTLGYRKGIAASMLHFADYYKDRGMVDSAVYYYDKAAKKANILNNKKFELFVNHSRSIFEQNLGNYDNALKFAKKNIAIYEDYKTLSPSLGTNPTFNLIGSEYEQIGGIHQELGNYRIALNETLKALRFFRQHKDTIRSGDALLQLGGIEFALGNVNKALEYVKEAHDIYNYFEDLQYQALSSLDIGKYFNTLNRPLDAKKSFEEALELAKKIKNKELKGNALAGLGNTYLELGNEVQAKDYLNSALSIHRELDYKRSISSDLFLLGKASQKTPEQAINYVSEAIAVADQIGTKDILGEAYAFRSSIYKKLKRYRLSLEDYEVFKAINDSIFNTAKSQQIEELRTIYDTEKKERQIVLQENEIDLLEQKAKIGTLQKFLLAGGLLLSLVGFYALRQKMKRNKLEKEKVDAELAFKKKELTTHALHLAKKNEVLESVKQKAKELRLAENSQGYRQLIQTINFDQQDDRNWENFTQYFQQVHKDFSANVKKRYPEVTKNELRFMALLKMNMSSKEIATILNISNEGIKKARQRLRKKMNLTPEDSLENTVLAI